MGSWKLWNTSGGYDWYTNIETGEVRGISKSDGRIVTRYIDERGKYMHPKDMDKLAQPHNKEKAKQ